MTICRPTFSANRRTNVERRAPRNIRLRNSLRKFNATSETLGENEVYNFFLKHASQVWRRLAAACSPWLYTVTGGTYSPDCVYQPAICGLAKLLSQRVSCDFWKCRRQTLRGRLTDLQVPELAMRYTWHTDGLNLFSLLFSLKTNITL